MKGLSVLLVDSSYRFSHGSIPIIRHDDRKMTKKINKNHCK